MHLAADRSQAQSSFAHRFPPTPEGRGQRRSLSRCGTSPPLAWPPPSVLNLLALHALLPLLATAAAAKSLQSCLTLCNPIDGSPPGSPVPGILQARTLEWVAISFSNA